MIHQHESKIKSTSFISQQALSSNISILPSQHPSTCRTQLIAKADSGASSHYIPLNYKNALLNLTETTGPQVHLADDSIMTATAKGTLPLTVELSTAAK